MDNSGPAFPYPSEYGPKLETSQGMTLRDYFAGQVLAGFFASGQCQWPLLRIDNDWWQDLPYPGFQKNLSRLVYEIADAMLTERSKGI